RTGGRAVPRWPARRADRDVRGERQGMNLLADTGRVFTLAAQVARMSFSGRPQVRETVEQFWFIASVTILPAALVSIPFGAVIALQVGSLTRQLGAEAFTGAARGAANRPPGR